jgi:flagellar hook-associated protein 3 FlgL
VTSVSYQGNQSVAESEIAEGVTMSAQIVGANSGGSGPRGLITDSRFGADLFNHLISLQNNLLSGDTAAIAATDRPALAKDEENLVLHFGNNGAVQQRLEASASLAVSRGDSLEVLVSQEADADLAQTLVRLNQTQNAYQAALQSGAKLLNTSLLDFLR